MTTRALFPALAVAMVIGNPPPLAAAETTQQHAQRMIVPAVTFSVGVAPISTVRAAKDRHAVARTFVLGIGNRSSAVPEPGNATDGSGYGDPQQRARAMILCLAH